MWSGRAHPFKAVFLLRFLSPCSCLRLIFKILELNRNTGVLSSEQKRWQSVSCLYGFGLCVQTTQISVSGSVTLQHKYGKWYPLKKQKINTNNNWKKKPKRCPKDNNNKPHTKPPFVCWLNYAGAFFRESAAYFSPRQGDALPSLAAVAQTTSLVAGTFPLLVFSFWSWLSSLCASNDRGVISQNYQHKFCLANVRQGDHAI